MLLNPKRGVREYPDEPSRQLMLAVIDFFETKGLARLKHDDHERVWYQDFLDFVKRAEALRHAADAARPRRRGLPLGHLAQLRVQRDPGLLRPRLLVHLAGHHPRARPDLDERQRGGQAPGGRLLAEGGIFAFGLSEKEHGADLYSSEMTLTRKTTAPTWRAARSTTSATPTRPRWCRPSARWPRREARGGRRRLRLLRRRPAARALRLHQERLQLQTYVAEFALHDYPITEADILSRGRDGLGRGAQHRQRRQVQPRLGLDRHLHPRLLRGHRPRRLPPPVRPARHRLPPHPRSSSSTPTAASWR